MRFPPRRLHGRWREGGGPGGNRHGEGSVRGILIVRGSTVRSREEIHREPGFQVFPASKTAGVLGKLIAAATDNGFFFHLHQFKRDGDKGQMAAIQYC